MDKSSITMTADDDWWLERVTMDGEQRYPKRIRVGSLDAPRVYVPERTCRVVRGESEFPHCSVCGCLEVVDDVAGPYEYCPRCGARVLERDS